MEDVSQANEVLEGPRDDECPYDDLEEVTVHTLSALNVDDYLEHSSAQFRYIGERTMALRRQHHGRVYRSTGLERIAVMVALTRLINHSDCLLLGTLSGMDCIRATPGLWNRMMCKWPMGEYGRTLATYINEHGLAQGKILELGAGVGQASKFVRVEPGTLYIKTDLNKAILQLYNRGGILEEFDIDSNAIPGHDFNLVFASNVLHCAWSKPRALENIFRMLAPGGYLVFTEGAPEVQPGREWCLSPLFGFLDGWWDRGGFVDLEQWNEWVRGAGFSITVRQPILSGRYTVGNLIACRKDGLGAV
jgi:SAM-dependent methyltransferase